MKKFKSFKVLALCLCLIIALAGCSNSRNKNFGGVSEKGYPKNISVFTALGSHGAAAGVKDNNDILGYQLLEERTGTHVEWIHPPQGAFAERFNIMIASGSLPDFIVYNWKDVNGGAKTYADDGVILPLKDLIAEHMPNLSAFMKENPEIAKEFTDDSGEIYYIPFIRGDKELGVFLGPQIRTDWLDKLGLEIPKTTDDLYNVLKAFKTQDPNGNGKADEIPMSGVGFGFSNSSYGIGNLAWAFGTHYGFYVEDGTVKHGILEDRFEEALAYICKLYEEGLIDVDFLLNDRSKMDAKTVNDRNGFLFSYQPTNYMNQMNDGKRKVAGIPYLTGPYGDKQCYYDAYKHATTGTNIAITTTCKDVASSLKWLDEFFGEPGLTYMNFGKEGLTFEMKDGNPVMTDYVLNNPDGKTATEMFATNIVAFESQMPTIQDWRYYEQFLSEWGSEAINIWAKDVDTDGILPKLSFNEEELNTLSSVLLQVQTYIEENVNKIVIGNEKLENLSSIRKTVKEMGLDKVLEIYNSAYERYQNK